MSHLSKSRFLAGWQCPKLLWWQVHEPSATELEPGVVLRDLFDQGQLVGERARAEWPDGVLIEGHRYDPERVVQTMRAIDRGARVLFEACCEADEVFCAIDILERNDSGAWTVIEVKSSNSVKDFHIPDLAVQVHVLRASGLRVTRAEVMHLNGAYRHPGGAPLFVREDVTDAVEAILPLVPHRIAEQLAVLDGELPVYPVGAHCWFRSDDGCPFLDRCWPGDPDHIRNLQGVGPKKTVQWMETGVHTMSAIPASTRLNPKQERQLRAQREDRMIVERGLLEALRPAIDSERLGFLDFETVGRAIPAWDGLGPWRQAAAQFSYHERRRTGETTHAEFLAEGPEDPSMLDATKDADRVVVYTSFEGTRIKELAEHLPHLAKPLHTLRDKLWDLNPVIANNVYHPGFRGSFSLKYILTPLVPDLSYNDLVIVDGKVASVEIARLLFVSGRIPLAERDKTRKDLLDYCERDTYATVRLVERLMEIAAGL
jgi:hypothetical protein